MLLLRMKQLCLLLYATVIGCVELSAITVEGEGGPWIWDEGEKVTLDLLQKSISVER